MALISNGTTIFDAGAVSSSFSNSMVLIKKLTASSDATLSFVNGASNVVFDSTYKEYMFTFNNIHPSANDATGPDFQVSTDGGSSYGVNITSTFFRTSHGEDGSDTNVQYQASLDLAQSTNFQNIGQLIGNDNDQSASGFLHIFNPSDTTFVKHFIARLNVYHASDKTRDCYTAGFVNSTSALNAIQFKMKSGNIDTGDICLYGIQ
tara:strand:- start:262 stop:879 length:618 start_codon:yes stop_codon:yes gene_type:complete